MTVFLANEVRHLANRVAAMPSRRQHWFHIGWALGLPIVAAREWGVVCANALGLARDMTFHGVEPTEAGLRGIWAVTHEMLGEDHRYFADVASRFVLDIDPPPGSHRFWGLVAMSVNVLEGAVWQTMGECEAEKAVKSWAAEAEAWLTEGTEGT